MREYICLDIGGTSIKHGIIDESLTFRAHGHTATQAFRGGAAVLETAVEIIRAYLGSCRPEGICVSTAGMVDVNAGSILHSGPQIPDYTGMPIKAKMEKILSIPCEVENDTNCAGLAEATSGAAKGAQSCLCLTIGTGIGGCLILNGSVYRGFSGSACEVGYMHMHGSSFQELASASILLKRVKQRKGVKTDGRKLFQLARTGDSVCIGEIERMAEYLAEGIANILYVVNPEVVLLGGGVMNERDYWGPLLTKHLEKRLLPMVLQSVRLEFTRFGNNAGMIGAYHHFLQMQELRKR